LYQDRRELTTIVNKLWFGFTETLPSNKTLDLQFQMDKGLGLNNHNNSAIPFWKFPYHRLLMSWLFFCSMLIHLISN